MSQFGLFFSSLAPHGEWIEVECGTRVWRPFHIPHEWHPYLIGRWVWTDEYGWYWMSNESFGWITYHYRRWYYDDNYGWVWMPDDVWAPAWVEWRYDENYIGWAPLPPYATLYMTFGIRFTTHWTAPANYWNIVRYYRFGTILRYRDTAPEEYARRLIHTGRTNKQYGIDHERIINRGVDRTIIEHRGNIRLERKEVREFREYAGEGITRLYDNRRAERIEVYRPTRDESLHDAEHVEARRGERNFSLDLNKVERPRIESRSSSDEHTPRSGTRTAELRHESGISREMMQKEKSRDGTSRAQEQQSKRDRQEMRRELIQRHERRQNPVPPVFYKEQHQRIERRRENLRITHPSKPTQGRQQ